jgi:hypothetical protein
LQSCKIAGEPCSMNWGYVIFNYENKIQCMAVQLDFLVGTCTEPVNSLIKV